MVKLIKKEGIQVLYITIPEPHTYVQEYPFIQLQIDDVLHSYPWEQDFRTTLELFCQDLSSLKDIDYIIAVNTEGEVYADGNFSGYTTPRVYRLEIQGTLPLELIDHYKLKDDGRVNST